MYSEQKDFDRWQSIVAGLLIAIIGYAVLVGIPVISTAWSNLLGFTDPQIGRVAGADLGGLSLGAVVTSFVIAKMNRRLLLIIGTLIAIVANALCMVITDYQSVLLLRLLAGFGCGIYTAIGVATLGATSKPAKAFNMMLFLFAFSQAAELYFLPKLSMNGIYLVFIATFILALPLILWVPPRPASPESRQKAQAAKAVAAGGAGTEEPSELIIPRYVPWLCLAAITATYVNIGAYWTYIELAASESPADPEFISTALWVCSFFSLIGCLFATLVSNRFGLARPLIVTLIVHAAIVGMLALGITNVTAIISLFAFNFLWIFIDVYQMSTVANVDPTGKYASLLPGAQGLGQIIGPLGASVLLERQFGYDAVFIMCACASLTAMVIYLGMYIKLRQTIPALADAT